jgi:putative pyruvate formate lyase activating enzyme
VNLSARELHERAAQARRHYASCDLCAHDCRVDRTHGPAGVCQEGDGLWLASAGVHFGEEPRLVPSGLILIGGCNLRCETCETFEFSIERRGLFKVSALELAANFVTPTHVLPALLEGLAAARDHGFSLPIVWNCGGYESLAALKLLEGVVDIYLPDAKYGDDDAAFGLSGCKGYVEALASSLAEMVRQVGAGNVIVRHLVLPEDAVRVHKLMPILARVSKELCLNVLTQYRPVFHAARFPVVSRSVNAAEVRAALRAARDAGLQNILLDGQPCPQLAAR